MVDPASAKKLDPTVDLKHARSLNNQQALPFEKFLESTAVHGCRAPSAEALEAFVNDIHHKQSSVPSTAKPARPLGSDFADMQDLRNFKERH